MELMSTPVKTELRFNTGDTEVMRFENNGDIYVKGRLVENDKEVVDALREFLHHSFKMRRDVKDEIVSAAVDLVTTMSNGGNGFKEWDRLLIGVHRFKNLPPN